MTRLAPRLPAEAAAIVLVAVLAALVELSVPAIVGTVLAAWLVIAALEIGLARVRRRR